MKVAPNTHSSFRPLFSTDHSQIETEALCSCLPGSASVLLSSLQLLTSSLEFLIVTLELEFPITPTKQTLHQFSNRYKARFFASAVAYARFKSPVDLQASQISNRESAIRIPRKSHKNQPTGIF